jgi:hypothetical protein
MNREPANIRECLLRPADLQLASPDAHLLTMRNALLDEWENQTRLSAAHDDQWTAAADRAGALARRMIEIRAFSLAGLQAKAIAVAYCQCGEEGELELNDQQTPDFRLAQSILKDLLGL